MKKRRPEEGGGRRLIGEGVVSGLATEGVQTALEVSGKIVVDLLNTTSSMSAVENKLKEVFGKQFEARLPREKKAIVK